MSEYNIITESEENLKAIALVVDNGIFIVISEGDYRFGTTALALPFTSDEGYPISYVLGASHEFLAKSLSEKAAKVTKRIVIVSVLIKDKSPSVTSLALRLFNKIIKQIK